jgi:hypothetical protein
MGLPVFDHLQGGRGRESAAACDRCETYYVWPAMIDPKTT